MEPTAGYVHLSEKKIVGNDKDPSLEGPNHCAIPLTRSDDRLRRSTMKPTRFASFCHTIDAARLLFV
ncbi:hypothetical protein QCM80_16780 [Bradyrhizobium sp. SSUT112]|uniref:hypothetical protein n=1 Tax=Bradyrhizobium sp. SSUT112 TaxID=3040604 RepID=UPI00244680AC|nr:hypothetical protein [Bradyrhizobium sp. SSUT112]MDH2352293.1 hypothetical protein [Bradyrhizobium sp. SSUT112]